ncbi:hypothetical protein AMTR_s00064p00191290 [Amborella trichopoda]|uniref:Uncharacterized protein n=2 Tax=Amborella trichopoda TaxID=13333 RepID=U5DBC7_AMBTC|nr:hypothetical protein AMTR_s00064p00191290 [Amborella trichopoda]
MVSVVRTADPDDFLLNYSITESQMALRTSALILNTFDDLEKDVIKAMRSRIACPLYTIGLLLTFSKHESKGEDKSILTSLWKEENECLAWLDKQQFMSVLYVNFGSVAVLTLDQLNEFAWGLANSHKPFIWITRRDLMMGEAAILSQEFMDEIKDRGLIANWCNQEHVLSHASVGGFLTHSGWNSILEAICNGVPVICWPCLGEQPTNCRYACTEWGFGMEIDNNVKREEVEDKVRMLMEGTKGKEMRTKIMKWKQIAEKAIKPGGSSYENLNALVREVLFKNYENN